MKYNVFQQGSNGTGCTIGNCRTLRAARALAQSACQAYGKTIVISFNRKPVETISIETVQAAQLALSAAAKQAGEVYIHRTGKYYSL